MRIKIEPHRTVLVGAGLVCLVVAVLSATRTPSYAPWYGGDCGSVAAWASNEDSGCNRPLMDLASLTVGFGAATLLLFTGALIATPSRRARVEGRSKAVAFVVVAPVGSIIAANDITGGTTWPRVPAAAVALAVPTIVILVARAPSSPPARRIEAVIVGAGAVGGSVAIAAFALMLWGGNGT